MIRDINQKKVFFMLDIFGFFYSLVLIMIMKNKNKKDTYLIYFTLISFLIYFYGRFLKNGKIMALFHTIYAIHTILFALLADDKELKTLVISELILIIATRRIFNGCLVRNIEAKSKISKNKFTNLLDWDIIFPSLALISLYRL